MYSLFKQKISNPLIFFFIISINWLSVNKILTVNRNSEHTNEGTSAHKDASTGEEHYVADPTSDDEMRKTQRNHIVIELIETEKQYLKDVQIIVEDLLYPILRKNV